LTKEELGLTHIGDLSEYDMEKTKRLALMELTALFDKNNVPMKTRRKPNVNKLKFKGIFPNSFSNSLMQVQNPL